MIKHLKAHYGNRPSSNIYLYKLNNLVNANQRTELNFLREEVRKLKALVGVSHSCSKI